jgi:transcription initiation factor IIE alpha subunit
MSRDKYIKDVVNDVKDSLFGNSAKKLFSFLVQNEELSEDEIVELLEMIKGNTPQ